MIGLSMSVIWRQFILQQRAATTLGPSRKKRSCAWWLDKNTSKSTHTFGLLIYREAFKICGPKKYGWAKCRKNMGWPQQENMGWPMQKKYALAKAERISPRGSARSAAPFGFIVFSALAKEYFFCIRQPIFLLWPTHVFSAFGPFRYFFWLWPGPAPATFKGFPVIFSRELPPPLDPLEKKALCLMARPKNFNINDNN